MGKLREAEKQCYEIAVAHIANLKITKREKHGNEVWTAHHFTCQNCSATGVTGRRVEGRVEKCGYCGGKGYR